MKIRKGFTLVELMIVVAIIGLLAAIGISEFSEMQYAAKRSEIFTGTDGLMTAQLAHDAAEDAFIDLKERPRSISALDKSPVTWVSDSNYDAVGWAPDGDVRGVYFCLASYSEDVDLLCAGVIDPDGDGNGEAYVSMLSSSVSQHVPEPSFWDGIIPSAHAGMSRISDHFLTNIDVQSASTDTVVEMALKDSLIESEEGSEVKMKEDEGKMKEDEGKKEEEVKKEVK